MINRLSINKISATQAKKPARNMHDAHFQRV